MPDDPEDGAVSYFVGAPNRFKEHLPKMREMADAVLTALNASEAIGPDWDPKMQLYVLGAVAAFIGIDLTRDNYEDMLKELLRAAVICYNKNTQAKAHENASSSCH